MDTDQAVSLQSPPLRILAVDISGLFSTHWEINQGKEDSHAYMATLKSISSARDGFDRIAICCDSGLSWRRAIWPAYKANRVDRGAAYRHQIARVIDQLESEACCVFRAPPHNIIGGDAGGTYYAGTYYAEADDVIGTLCAWAVEGGHFVRIYSGDKDLLQLVGDGVEAMNFKGDVFRAEDVQRKFGLPPERIPDMLALGGDTSDNFKPFVGIGDKRAVDLVKACGCAMAVFDPKHYDRLHEYIGNAAASAIKLGGREPAEQCLQIATVLRTLEIDFDPLLESPAWKPAAPEKTLVFSQAPAEEPPPAKPAPREEAPPAPPPAPVALIRQPDNTERYSLNPYSLEPTDPQHALALASLVMQSTLFRKFVNDAAALMVILEGRALGIPSIIALKNAYIVKGNVAWSARLIRGLAMKSRFCEYFRIVESSMERAVAVCKRVGDPEFTVVSDMQQAAARELIKKPGRNRDGKETEGNKWFTDPLVMHVADVERRGARMGWPDVVAGLYTPDEMESGVSADGVQIIEAESP